MSTKDITLTVTSAYKVPSFLLNASPEKIEHALNLAEVFLESGNTFNHETTVKTLHDKIKQLQLSTESQREEAIRIVRAELKAEAAVKDTLVQEVKRHNERLEHQNTQLEE